MLRSRQARIALFGAAIVLVQLGTRAGGKPFFLTQLTMSAYYTLVAVGLSVLMGYAGQLSLGHAAFFAIGGYASGWLTTNDLSPLRASALVAALDRAHLLVARPDLYGGETLTVHPWAAFAVAVALAFAVAWAIGIPVLKLKGHYLAMATLGFGTIVYSIVLGTARFGAADGLSSVPPLPLPAGLSVSGERADRVSNYYVAWGLVALAMLLLANLVESRVGRALRAIHGAEDAAGSMGVDVARFKLKTFVLSAVLAAVGGSFLTHFNGGIGPGEAAVMKSVRYVAIVAVGGMGSLWGTVATSLALNFLSLRGYFGTLDDAVFGGVLLAVMLFSPDGILRVDVRGLVRALAARARDPRKPEEPA
ncbi:MAG TPA: branched-chain amino acid ABC transporter permease [Anaeromyxobacteraceae bacterium]|nr:branched-chain amino acid ABC transporter permease [Anaeromyxobacteraceae bacterium]